MREERTINREKAGRMEGKKENGRNMKYRILHKARGREEET